MNFITVPTEGDYADGVAGGRRHEEDEAARVAAIYSFALVARRSRRTMWAWQGWPGRFTLLVDANEERVSELMHELMGDYENFKLAVAIQDELLTALTVLTRRCGAQKKTEPSGHN